MKQKGIAVLLTAALCICTAASAEAATVTTGLPDNVDEAYYSRPEEDMISLEDMGLNVIYDLGYCGENSTDYQKLHLVLPEGDGPHPVLVFVHGGVWASCNSEDHKVSFTAQAALRAVERGYAVALVDYSIRNADNDKALPNVIYEIKAAVRYLRSAADEYSLDSDKIALIGESAGGQLVDIVGTTNGETSYDKEEFGNMDYSSDVQAVIAQYSVGELYSMDNSMASMIFGTDMESLSDEDRIAMLDEASATEHVDAEDPPFYLEAGLSDATVSYTQSCDLYNALITAGDDEYTELHLYPGMDHAVSWFQSEENAEGYLNWLDKVFDRG